MITEPLGESRRHTRLKDVVSRRQSGLVVVLENISDPHNAGAVLRTCDAFGIQTIHFVFETQPGFNPKKKTQSTSTSVAKWLTLITHTSTQKALSELKQGGYTIAVTAIEGSTNVYDASLGSCPKVALVLGNEHDGVSATALQMADCTLSIPMRGMVQSLNLSVTTALMVAELTRQRQQSGIAFALSPTEQAALLQTFKTIDTPVNTVPDRPYLGVFND